MSESSIYSRQPHQHPPPPSPPLFPRGLHHKATSLKHKHPPGRTLHQLRARARPTLLHYPPPIHHKPNLLHTVGAPILPGSATLCDPTAAHPRIFPPFACERPCTDCCALAIAIKDIIDRPIGRPSLARVNYLLRSDHPPLTITLSSPGLAIPSHKTAPHSRAAAPTLVPAPPPAPPAQDAKTRPPRPTATPP